MIGVVWTKGVELAIGFRTRGFALANEAKCGFDDLRLIAVRGVLGRLTVTHWRPRQMDESGGGETLVCFAFFSLAWAAPGAAAPNVGTEGSG